MLLTLLIRHLNHVFFVSKTMEKSTLRFFPLAVKRNIVSASFGASECSLPLEVKAWIEEFEKVDMKCLLSFK